MTRPDIQPLREILQQAQRRYLTVRPHGFELNPGTPLRPVLDARILGFGGARTLYQDRKPHCRSLDGIRPIAEDQRSCAECRLQSRCTPQLRLDLLADTQPFRLLHLVKDGPYGGALADDLLEPARLRDLLFEIT